MFNFLKRLFKKKEKPINLRLDDYNKGIILQVNNEVDNKAFIEAKRKQR